MKDTQRDAVQIVMSTAWKIAKYAVMVHGGKASEYFSESLKSAWKSSRPAALAAPKSLSTKAKSARSIAKFIGGKALTGTPKQKEWAEVIRAEKLSAMSADQAELVFKSVSICGNAKFWIETRSETGAAIGKWLTDLVAEIAELNAATDKDSDEHKSRLASLISRRDAFMSRSKSRGYHR